MPYALRETGTPRPFVKWAGGKRQLIGEIGSRMPSDFGGYVEPFLGGGAVFFALGGRERSVLNDMNPVLVNAYASIRDDPDGVISALAELDAGMPDTGSERGKRAMHDYYYAVRECFNGRMLAPGAETAALFVFVNKHCFNGLYRVNRNGVFNVPYNGSHAPSYDEGNIRAVSEALQGVTLMTGDFSSALGCARPGDFAFIDSPYAPLNPTSFLSYTKEGFPIEDHRRLAATYRELDGRGVLLMATNNDTDLVRELYHGFNIETVDVRRSVNRNGDDRRGREVIITNY